MLEQKPEFEVVEEASSGQEAIDLADRLKPDVILMDLLMPGMSGLEAITRICQSRPETHILVLTSFSKDDDLIAAIKAGATGYLIKDSSPSELVRAIHQVHEGAFSFTADFTRRLVLELRAAPKKAQPKANLTGREVSVLRLAANGKSNAEIAAALFITEGTVRFHFSNILHKLELPSRTQAVLFALRTGLADLN